MKRLWLYMLFMAAGILLVRGQDMVVLTTGQYGAFSFSPDTSNEDIVIPMRQVQNLFLIEVWIDGQRGNFILDTGAPGLVLNMGYFPSTRRLESASAFGVTGEGTPVYRYMVDSMDIHGLKFNNISANVADLGHIENALGIKILGLIGTGLFQGMEMELDLKNNFLGLYHMNRDGSRVHPENEVSAADLEIPLEVSSSLWFIKAYIAGKKLRFVLDTGAETNVLNTNISRKVIEKVELNNLTTLKGSNASTVQVASGILPELYVMEQVYENMPFVLTDLSNLELAYDTTMDGMLGYAFLRCGRMVINTKKKFIKVYFYQEEK